MIAIIIPFYQNRPGLLRKAVASILAQQGVLPWHLLVVDDGSPCDPLPDLAPMREALAGRWTLIRKPNGGPSSARNAALDRIGSAYETVAFLDSDDSWDEGHLARIATAFAAGADFYFGNCRRYDDPQSRFERFSVPALAREAIDPAQRLYWFEGDLFDALLRGSPAATSAIAYRFARAPRLRFRTDLHYCEDIFFWMQISAITRRIAFSPVDGVFCGKGVNISEGAWGSLHCARQLASQSRYHQLVQGGFSLSRNQRAWNNQALKGLDVDFWRASLAAAARGEYRCLKLAGAYLRQRPGALGRMPLALGRLVRDKFVRTDPSGAGLR